VSVKDLRMIEKSTLPLSFSFSFSDSIHHDLPCKDSLEEFPYLTLEKRKEKMIETKWKGKENSAIPKRYPEIKN
jgi:hypothetical protein